MDDFRLQVRVSIAPLWMSPETSNAQRLGREQAEARMEAFAHDLSRFIADALEHKTAAEWAEASHKLRKYFSDRV